MNNANSATWFDLEFEVKPDKWILKILKRFGGVLFQQLIVCKNILIFANS